MENIDRSILIIDDEPNNLEIMEEYLKLGPNNAHDIIKASNGKEGLGLLKNNYKNIDVILLDRMMPIMGGVEFLQIWKDDPNLKKIPVIMQTASNEQQHMQEGFRLGVYHYLVKPYMPTVLNSVVSAAIEFYTQQRELSEKLSNSKAIYEFVEHAEFKIKNLDDANLISISLAQFFPNPSKVALGISELLVNAIEHGNLGIDYEEKTKLNLSCEWQAEIKKRANLQENINKEVVINYFKKGNEIVLNIKDQGPGFDYSKFLDFDINRSTDNHGRGIAFAHAMSFDSIEYVGNGNEVNCTVKLN